MEAVNDTAGHTSDMLEASPQDTLDPHQEHQLLKKKVGKPRKDLTKQDIEQYLHLPQQEAALVLNVSVSTLKRRYQEYFRTKTRWPSPAQRSALGRQRLVDVNKLKMRLCYILNYNTKPTAPQCESFQQQQSHGMYSNGNISSPFFFVISLLN